MQRPRHPNPGQSKPNRKFLAIEQAIEQYRINTGRLPDPGTGLCTGLPDMPRGTRCRDGDPLDPWGRPYKYDQPGVRNSGNYDLYSLGADGRQGGTDEDADIGNW